jgi:hypothetical protein
MDVATLLFGAVVFVGAVAVLFVALSSWGINLYPAEYGGSGWIEFDSMINVRPGQGNRSRSVDDPAIRGRIEEVVGDLVG